MRITNSMITGKYSRNLNSAMSALDYYNNRATTLRKFDKVSEDPVSAAKAFRLRRSFYENENYNNNTANAENQILTAETSMRTINGLVQEVSSGDLFKAVTSTSGQDERNIIASKIHRTMDAIVASANAQYGDKYIFGASDTTKPPLTVSETGQLLYRGVDVNTGKLVNEDGAVTKSGVFKISFGEDNAQNFNGYTVNIIDDAASTILAGEAEIETVGKTITVNLPAGSTGQDLQDALQTANITGALTVDLSKITVSGDLAKETKTGVSAPISDTVDLKALAEEAVYIDLGLGVEVSAAGKVNAQSAFNVSIPGISFLGYGEDVDGNPKNIYSLFGQLADELGKENFSYDRIIELEKSLKTQEVNLLSNVTELGVRSNFLINSKTRLEDASFNIKVQINDTEYLDAAEAIMDFKLQEYIYNAALSMGSKVIQPSFLDFMR